MQQANLSEVFTSVQGEGIYSGRVQLFIRFTDCNLRCYYCDTVSSLRENEYAFFEKTPLSFKYVRIKNPIEMDFLVAHIQKIVKEEFIHGISITGGEPLLQVEFLEIFLSKLGNTKPIHLETNGTLPEDLKRIIKYIDFVSMDLKTDYFKEQAFIDTQKSFLKISKEKDCQVKIIVSKKLKEDSFKQAVDLVSEIDKKIPFILQPNTKEIAQVQKKLIKFYKLASKKIENILILPQIHALIGLK
ncbi:MAG: 7-carboxy-7-deazaguanine synthase QueE [Proteobacteria bacterium]|nr:7-carboxy-7-deazaguanine synthase QueE [Pseudomonadota bacterium]